MGDKFEGFGGDAKFLSWQKDFVSEERLADINWFLEAAIDAIIFILIITIVIIIATIFTIITVVFIVFVAAAAAAVVAVVVIGIFSYLYQSIHIFDRDETEYAEKAKNNRNCSLIPSRKTAVSKHPICRQSYEPKFVIQETKRLALE